MKKIILIAISLLICFTAIPMVYASADVSKKVNKTISFSYNKKSKTLTFKGKGKLSTKIEYGSFSDDHYWESITKWDKYKKSVKKIVVKSGITEIGTAAFSDCKALTTVVFPKSLKKIGNYAFYRCAKLNKITLGSNVTKIGSRTFWKCSALKNVALPKSLKSIGRLSFVGCKNLSKISISSKNKYFTVYNGTLYNKKKTMLIANPIKNAKNAKLKIAATTTKIYAMAFSENKYLTNVVIPKSVKYINGGAFYNCKSLKSISFEKNSSLTKIADFYNYYGDDFDEDFGTFEYTSIADLKLPESLKTLGKHSIRNCSTLSTLYFGKAFEGTVCGYTKTVDFRPEYRTSISAITVSADNAKYSSLDGVLYNKELTTLICYPAGKTDESFAIPESVKTIGSFGFNYNDNISKITLPQALERLNECAIVSCKKLKEITVPATVTTIDSYAIGYKNINNNYYADNDTLYSDGCEPTSFTIIGTAGSVAEKYATDNKFTWKAA